MEYRIIKHCYRGENEEIKSEYRIERFAKTLFGHKWKLLTQEVCYMECFTVTLAFKTLGEAEQRIANLLAVVPVDEVVQHLPENTPVFAYTVDEIEKNAAGTTFEDVSIAKDSVSGSEKPTTISINEQKKGTNKKEDTAQIEQMIIQGVRPKDILEKFPEVKMSKIYSLTYKLRKENRLSTFSKNSATEEQEAERVEKIKESAGYSPIKIDVTEDTYNRVQKMWFRDTDIIDIALELNLPEQVTKNLANSPTWAFYQDEYVQK